MRWAIPVVLVLVGGVVAVLLYFAGNGVEATVVGAATVEGGRRTIKRTLRRAEKDREVERTKVEDIQARASEVVKVKPGSLAPSDLAQRAAERRSRRSRRGGGGSGAAMVLLIVLSGSGCVHVPTTDLWPEPFPRYEPPVLIAADPGPDDCEDFVPFPRPPEEEIAPVCSGVLIPPTELDLFLRVEESIPLLGEALSIAYSGRDRDRQEAAAILQAREDQLRVAREAQGRWFVVGAGLGGGAVVAVVVAVLIAR